MSSTRDLVSFKVTREEDRLISAIAKRAQPKGDRTDLLMDLTACHANGCRLRLKDLLAADEFNFWHDISGIQNCIDRETGRLTSRFLPRFSAHD